LSSRIRKRAFLNGRYVIHVFRVTTRKRLKELDPFLNKQTVDVLKETQAGGGIVEHLFCFLVLRFVNVNEWGTCEVR